LALTDRAPGEVGRNENDVVEPLITRPVTEVEVHPWSVKKVAPPSGVSFKATDNGDVADAGLP
jgi:hypothetical protein